MSLKISKRNIEVILFCIILPLLACQISAAGQGGASENKSSDPAVVYGKDGKLVYTIDSIGNRIPDFSYCGYKNSEVPIPLVPARIVVPVMAGDATARIQKAIDYVSALSPAPDGTRGAVLLERGVYRVSGRLVIRASGVVIRGSGMNPEGTFLVASGKDRQTLIRILGRNDIQTGDPVRILNTYVPVNALGFRVEKPGSFQPGDRILIRRPSTQEWINLLGMADFGGETAWLGWKPGQRDLAWYRRITAVTGNLVSVDAPVTTAMDSKYGGGFVESYRWPGQINHAGIENLCLQSDYDITSPKDEQHCWSAITIENAEDCWIRQVVFRHFAGSAVAVYETSQRVTVEDCISLQPVSEIGGQRRNTFFTMGQLTLFQRIFSERGYHDFAAGFCACGPNAFVQCESSLPFGFSGAVDSWTSGLLFDIVNVDGHDLCFKNREQNDHGAGWCAANSMFWQCTASRINCYAPPGAYNWAYGAWAQFSGNGIWFDANNHVTPRSLFYAQLAERTGKKTGLYEERIMPVPGNPTSSPTIVQARELNELSKRPVITLRDWIQEAPLRNPEQVSEGNAPDIDEIPFHEHLELNELNPVQLENGWLVEQKKGVVTGKRAGVPWWRGDPRPYEAKNSLPAITRFVPGRNGTGYTDNLEEVVQWMTANGILALDHNHGLWYDRRRDDHERVRRSDGEVWAPFYELPFARSGRGTAWDGLSKYDLTKYNDWYWDRLKQFADLADQSSLVLIHQHYFQHNILEAGAHWADFPWRTANNINETGFPEPPPYAGDKRIFMDEQFYDISNPVRREIHRSYIRKCLAGFSDNKGVIHLISAEYTGPLHFVRFWLDVIDEWEKETGKNLMIGLSTTKDVQDSVLADSKLSGLVDLIDIRYWSYRADGSLFAPAGGQHLAPRQHARLVNPGNRSFDQVYRAVAEYRLKYPGKAVIFSEGNFDRFPWAVFMAGGSLANLPEITDPAFLKAASGMNPVDMKGDGKSWALGDVKNGFIVYARPSADINLDVAGSKGKFQLFRIDPSSGSVTKTKQVLKAGKTVGLKNETKEEIIFWLKSE